MRPPPEWHPYFEVADVDTTLARATEAGATVIIPAAEAEGIGRFAMLLDPAGAVFAVIRSTGPTGSQGCRPAADGPCHSSTSGV